MGDHARREMIVRSARVLRQNPAYRPYATLQPPMLTYRRLLLLTPSMSSIDNMTRNTCTSILVLLATAGCAGGRVPGRVAPTPVPSVPTGSVSDNGPWPFAYRSDSIRVQISRSAAIESQADSGVHREISTNNTRETLTLTVEGDTVRYTAIADSFSTASQGQIGNVQPVSLPVQISGIVGLSASVDSAISSCDPVQATLETDVRNLLVAFPQQLTPAQTWRDSVVRVGCYGSIPMRAMVVRTFSVVGRTTLNGQSAVAIQRRDSVSAHGEGRQQQHQLVIDASGTGSATYYLIPDIGRLLHLTTSQDLEFAIRASGRMNRFRESAKEEFNPAP